MNFQGLLGGIGQALSNPKFRLLWWTNTVNSTGRWQYKFAVSWYTWETTKSPALLGIVAFADTVPLVFMTVIAGAWTDRYSTMLIMRMCQSIMVAAGILISVFALTESLNIIYIIVLSFVIGAAEAVTVPARLSVVHQLVSPRITSRQLLHWARPHSILQGLSGPLWLELLFRLWVSR